MALRLNHDLKQIKRNVAKRSSSDAVVRDEACGGSYCDVAKIQALHIERSEIRVFPTRGSS